MAMLRVSVLFLLSLFSIVSCASGISQVGIDAQTELSPVQRLGQQIFFDKNLSSPAGQSCASCHDQKTAFTDASLSSPVSDGVVPGRTGVRNTPSIVYSIYSPDFHFESQDSTYIGGQFLDGRAADLSEQAKGPFLNPDEMNNGSEAEVVVKLRSSAYVDLFKRVYGSNALDDEGLAYQHMADAIAQFEKAGIFNRFTAKYDYYLAGEVELTDQERWGLKLFNDEKKGNCAACHPSESDNNIPPLFTDYSYDNLGVPRNPTILSQKGTGFIDLGLGKALNNSNENGKFKVPSLRNIAKTSPYMHNGVFTSLRDAVEFYSTRDTDAKWGKPEVAENVNKEELGDLKLSKDEIDALVAFLNTLTDGYELSETVNHLNNSGLVSLPLVKVEGNFFNSIFLSVKLKNDTANPSLYRLLYAEALETSTNTNIGSIPHFSLDSGYLDIPVIKVDGSPDYIVQLKQVATEKDYVFVVNYAKPLQ